MPPPTRPPSSSHIPSVDNTEVRIAIVETRLESFERLLEQTRVEMREGLSQLGADLGGLATKEELRDVSSKLEQLTRSVDRLIGSLGRDPRLTPTEPMRSGGRDKQDSPTKGKDDGDITVKALFWNILVAGLKLIGAGVLVALIVLAINSKSFKTDSPLPAIGEPASVQPAPTAPPRKTSAGGSPVAAPP